MRIEYRGWRSFERRILQLQSKGITPKVIVFAGTHEPAEPSKRIVTARVNVDGRKRMLHNHFDPNEVIFVTHSQARTPKGYYERYVDFIKSSSSKLRSTLFIHQGLEKLGITPKSSPQIEQEYSAMLGDYLQRYLKEIEALPNEKIGGGAFKGFHDFNKYLRTQQELSKRAQEDLLALYDDLKQLKHMPEKENDIICNLARVIPDTSVILLHTMENKYVKAEEGGVKLPVIYYSYAPNSSGLANQLARGAPITTYHGWDDSLYAPNTVALELPYPDQNHWPHRKANIGAKLHTYFPGGPLPRTDIREGYLEHANENEVTGKIPASAEYLHKTLTNYLQTLKRH
ncbi:hypothetical protein J4220_02265 [Candidatus Micrarchaeota archaeon]|nr:hypothetical protein [Candidatus Micrarchaeota archaeon]HIH20041.1 hypothetical protein [Candidatus Micrarchaeota archaeon]